LGGCIAEVGLSYGDFCRLMLEELEWIVGAHRERRIRLEDGRLLTTMNVQPHCRKRLDPRELLPFP